MNDQLLKFIELCLVDGIISDKEREVIFRKSDELGVPKDECEIILEGLLHKVNSTNKTEKNQTQKSTKLNIELLDSYVDVNDVKRLLNNLDVVEEKMKYFDENMEKMFDKWKNENLEKCIKNNPSILNLDELKMLMNRNGGFFRNSNKQSWEYRNREYINSKFRNEVFWGYYNKRNDRYIFSPVIKHLYTDKTFHSLQGESNTDTFEIEYKKILSPIKYYLDYICDEILYINNSPRRERKVGDNFPFTPFSDNDIFKNLFNSFIKKTDLNYFNELKKLNISIDSNLFLEKIKNLDLSIDSIDHLIRINNYIDRMITNFNSRIDCLKLENTEVIDIYEYGNKKNPKTNWYLNSYPIELIQLYKSTIVHVLSILQLRDDLLNKYLTGDIIQGKEIYLKLENMGVFFNKFERTQLEKLDGIINGINLLNNSIIEGFSSLSSSIHEVGKTLSEISSKLDNITGSISLNNLIQGISTYQLYKINKSLRQ